MSAQQAGGQPIVSPEDQKVTFVELFFDLVFVFSVTQVVGLFHDGVTWLALGQVVLIFWLVWWAWTQYSWTLNAADTTHSTIQLVALTATAAAFFMAVAVPDAFHDRSAWFAITYVLVRAIGLGLHAWVASADPSQRAAVRRFALVSVSGLAAVLLGGLIGGTAQYLLWGLAILLDVVAAAIGGQADSWNLHPEHFSERHGLFVIIALGETLIITAGGVTGVEWTTERFAGAILAVAVTGGLWWTYFPRAKPILDQALEASQGSAQAKMARDVFSLLHFLMAFGIISYAVAVEYLVAHLSDPLSLAARVALAAGLLLFVGGMALAIWRATGRLLRARVGLTIATAVAVVVVAPVNPLVSLAIALAGILLVAVVEQRASSLT